MPLPTVVKSLLQDRSDHFSRKLLDEESSGDEDDDDSSEARVDENLSLEPETNPENFEEGIE